MKKWRGPILYADIWYVQRSEAEAERERLTARVAELEVVLKKVRAYFAVKKSWDNSLRELREAKAAVDGALSDTSGGEPTPQTVDPRRGVTGAEDLPTSGRW